MSGECEVCHEHCLDCKCPIIRERKWVSKEEAKKMFPDNDHQEKNWFGMTAEIKEDGLCYFEDGTIVDPNQPINNDNV